MAITLRSTKGSALTHTELDNNFRDLNGRLIDSDGIITIIDAVGFDSSAATGLIDSAYIQARQTTVTPADGLDSADVTSLIDSAYVQARQTLGLDSASTISLIDSAYVQARQSDVGIDSSAVISLIDSDYIQAKQILPPDLLELFTTVFNISNDDTANFIFSDSSGNYFPSPENDPVLYLRRGETYRFNNPVYLSHPFQIQDSENGSAYNTGVSNNANVSGQFVVFTPPMSAPSTLYYICTNHSTMGNVINIV
jgi:hypothetical protein